MTGQSPLPEAWRRYRWLFLVMLATLFAAWLTPNATMQLDPAWYLPMHGLLELVSIVIAVMVFGIVWHRHGPDRPAALFWLACALFAAAWLDFAHIVARHEGANMVAGGTISASLYFRLLAQFVFAIVWLAILFLPGAGKRQAGPPHRLLATALLLVAGAILLVVQFAGWLPVLYPVGQGAGVIGFAGWLIVALLGVAFWRLQRNAGALAVYDPPALQAAIAVAALSILSCCLFQYELDLHNLLGHVFKIVSYAVLYRALFVANVVEPYQTLQARGEELAAAHERLRGLLESSPDWVWEVDVRGVYTYVSPRVRDLLGYAPEDVLGRTPFDFMSPAEARRVRLTFEAIARERLPFSAMENINLDKSGREHVLETSGVPILSDSGELLGYRGIDRDVSARHQAEHALEAERVHLRTLVNAIPDLVWLKDPDGVYLACNPTFERFFGAREADILGKTDYDFVERELADFFRENDCLAIASDGPRINEEEVVFADDGHRALLQTIKTPMRDSVGRLIGVLGIARDITSSRAAEDALRDSQEKLNRAQEVAHIGSWHLDVRKDVLSWTDECYRLFGVPIGSPLTYETFLGRVHPDDRTKVDTAWKSALRGEPYDIEHRLLIDGETRWVRERADLMFEPDGELIGGIGITQDITGLKQAEQERMRLERQLRQAQKMEALGQLTGGIAHDFNNILASVLGYSKLAQSRPAVAEDPRLTQYLANVVTASERARDLIAKMLAYTRIQSDSQSAELAPAPLVHDALRMLRSIIPTSIELEARVDDGTPSIRVDAVEFQQILVNLAVNARDAIGETGRIEIGLHLSTEVGSACVLCQEAITGEYVALEVVDSGGGIATDDVARIFDPFFTTKDVGKGSGLGLSVVHGIVKKYGGHVLVHSRPGRGSVFRVLFPAVARAAEPAKPTESALAPASRTGARIWIVDDEPLVAGFLNELLTAEGYLVRVFNAPDEALRAFESDSGAVDAVLTDQTMPGLTGGELAQALLNLRADLPIVLCTGYSEHMDEVRAQALGIRHFCHKPVDTARLLAAVADSVA